MISRIPLSLTILALLLGMIIPQATSAQNVNVEESLKQALALVRAGKLAEAEQPLNRLLAETNGTAIPKNKLLFYRAFLRGDNGRFQEAATDLEQVIDIDPSHHEPWFFLMPLLVQTGETEEYRSYCRKMLNRFGNTTNFMIAERTAKCCLLMPSAVSGDDLTQAAKMAERALAVGKKGEVKPWRVMTKGLSEYRQGHFARAIETMELAQKDIMQAQFGGLDPCKADTYFVSAMAYQQLKQADKARTAFGHGRVIVLTRLPTLDSGNLSPIWADVLMTYTLMHEAQKTVEGATADQNK
jgi:tetratricopeptide (TPR) repeat protein